MCKWKPISTVEGEAGEAESPDGFAYYLWGVALRRSGESFEGSNLGTAVDEDLMEVKSRGKSGNLKEFKGTSTENIRKPLYMSQSKKKRVRVHFPIIHCEWSASFNMYDFGG